MTPVSLAQAIPTKVRKVIYSLLATAVGLEAIFDVIDDGWEAKILAALVVLGFGIAVPNTPTPPAEEAE